MPTPPEPDATLPSPKESEAIRAGAPISLAQHPHYRIERELGRGGMGVVYLAHNTLLDRLEVLKVIGRDLLNHPGSSERFLQEMRSAARLNHPNVVAAYTALSDGSFLALAMEYVKGEDLSKVVRKSGPLSVQLASFYTAQAAAGLQHAYEQGMVHRDIKPSNLMLSTNGKKAVVKILDFGLAKVTQAGLGGGLTASGALLGTPEFMAPEQVQNAARADIRSDLYSLGCTLYFFLVGETPFPAPNMYAVMHAHQTAPLPDPGRFRKDVPEELVNVICKMTAKLPIDRYQTPVEVVKALTQFYKSVPAVNATPSPTHPRSTPRVIMAEFVDDSAASDENIRQWTPESDMNPSRENTPVNDQALRAKRLVNVEKKNEKAAVKSGRKQSTAPMPTDESESESFWTSQRFYFYLICSPFVALGLIILIPLLNLLLRAR